MNTTFHSLLRSTAPPPVTSTSKPSLDPSAFPRTFSVLPPRSASSSTNAFAVTRRNSLALILSTYICTQGRFPFNSTTAYAHQETVVQLREYIDSFDGYSFKYPRNWIEVKGAGADIFFRDPVVLDENISVEMSSPSSSSYKSVADLGDPEEAGKKVLKQYLTEFMSTRLGVRREASVLSTSSRIADDGKLYYQVEVPSAFDSFIRNMIPVEIFNFG